jgi:Protein of unknown function TPD sequence-motif
MLDRLEGKRFEAHLPPNCYVVPDQYQSLLQAMFGDVYTHQASVLPQAEAFVHRFGPGLILYWFGHAPPERLADASGDVFISSWELPNRFMLPTGEVLHRST